MLVAVEDVVDEAVDDGGFAHSLVAQEDDLVLEQWGDGALGQVQVAYICHCLNLESEPIMWANDAPAVICIIFFVVSISLQ